MKKSLLVIALLCITFVTRAQISADSLPPMPVKLLYFQCENLHRLSVLINLKWATATEINNDHFEVYGTNDGFNWTAILWIIGAGSVDVPQYYEYTASRYAYYKLRQVDYDGAYEDFPVIAGPLAGQNAGARTFITLNGEAATDDALGLKVEIGEGVRRLVYRK